jgi:kynurenine formamidase
LTKKTTDSHTQSATRIIAPAAVAPGLWSVDQIPAGRLVAPLVVLDISAKTHNQTDSQVSVEDIARWEHMNGEIPLGAVVMARTGTTYNRPGDKDKYVPAFSEDAALFLVEGRKILGLGSDEPSFGNGSSRADQYALSHSVYYLENVADLDRVPARGAVIVVAPTKVEGRSSAPVRIMALVQ